MTIRKTRFALQRGPPSPDHGLEGSQRADCQHGNRDTGVVAFCDMLAASKPKIQGEKNSNAPRTRLATSQSFAFDQFCTTPSIEGLPALT
jgi:hypothetical protein